MSYTANVHIHYNGKAYAPDKVIPFKEGDEELRDQLLADEAISRPASPANPKSPAEPKPLAGLSVKQLKATATAEKVDIPEGVTDAPAIIALIEAARAAAAQTE